MNRLGTSGHHFLLVVLLLSLSACRTKSATKEAETSDNQPAQNSAQETVAEAASERSAAENDTTTLLVADEETPSEAAAGPAPVYPQDGSLDAIYAGYAGERRDLTKVMRAQDLREGRVNEFFPPKPVLSFRVEKTTDLYIGASAPAQDLILSIVGGDWPYRSDDVYNLDPALSELFEPGLYHVYVGIWGGLNEDVSYTLSFGEGLETFYGECGGGPPPLEFPKGQARWDTPSALGVVKPKPRMPETAGTVDGLVAGQVEGCDEYFDLRRPLVELDSTELANGKLRLELSVEAEGRRLKAALLLVDAQGQLRCGPDFHEFSGPEWENAGFEWQTASAPHVKIYGGLVEDYAVKKPIVFTLKIRSKDE